MRDFLEWVLLLGGSLLVLGKLGGAIAALIMIIYLCYKFNQLLQQTRLLRSFAECQTDGAMKS